MSIQIGVPEALDLEGYTTLEQAHALGERVLLSAETRLLDVGAGSGWPGTYLAESAGCSLVSTDIVFEGLVAGSRARAERAAPTRADTVLADGRALPFRSGTFDAVLHADALC